MNENLSERFDQFDGEYLKWERISPGERLHPSPTLCAYLKIASLLKDPARFHMEADHDVIWLASPGDFKEELTDADILYLTRCGIHYDSEGDCLADFC